MCHVFCNMLLKYTTNHVLYTPQLIPRFVNLNCFYYDLSQNTTTADSRLIVNQCWWWLAIIIHLKFICTAIYLRLTNMFLHWHSHEKLSPTAIVDFWISVPKFNPRFCTCFNFGTRIANPCKLTMTFGVNRPTRSTSGILSG